MSKMGSEYIRRTESSLCVRCGEPRYDNVRSNICGSCADDLRAEEEAMIDEARAIDEAYEKARWEGLNEQREG